MLHTGKYEELIVCSHEIAASTAQLVAASKVSSRYFVIIVEICYTVVCHFSQLSHNIPSILHFFEEVDKNKIPMWHLIIIVFLSFFIFDNVTLIIPFYLAEKLAHWFSVQIVFSCLTQALSSLLRWRQTATVRSSQFSSRLLAMWMKWPQMWWPQQRRARRTWRKKVIAVWSVCVYLITVGSD